MLEHTAAGAPRRRHSPFPWLEDLGFRRADLAVFGAEVRLLAAAGGALLARHRDAAGRETGWECVAAPAGGPRDGRLRYAHTPGDTKALFRSPRGGGPGREHRLLVADGALPAIAAAACDRRWSRTRYAGVGGVWTEAAALAV